MASLTMTHFPWKLFKWLLNDVAMSTSNKGEGSHMNYSMRKLHLKCILSLTMAKYLLTCSLLLCPDMLLTLEPLIAC